MGANIGTSDNRKFYKLVAKAEKADQKGKKAICEVVKKNNKYEVDKWYSSLSGFITNLEVKEFEFEGAKKEKCVLDITDSSGVCQIEFTFNFATYGLINALLGADFKRELSIEAWIGKTGYVGAGVKYVGYSEGLKWAIELDNTPKGQKYKTPSGKEETDYSDVTAFWKDKFLSLKPKAVRTNFSGTIAEKPQSAIQNNANFEKAEASLNNPNPSHIPDEEDTDLPF